jgi:ATPase subunit of ABC transporter with duplicated ATPase domains
LRALAGLDRELDAGDVQVRAPAVSWLRYASPNARLCAPQVRKGTRVAFLPQEPLVQADAPVLSAVLQGDAPVLRLLARYESALAAAADGSAAAAAELARLTPEMDAADAWGIEAEVRTILDKLGCTSYLGRKMGQLSGGQAKRVALATALISSPDILILDEPTNHLSVEGVEWLEARLADPALTVLMVTHDRAFMDSVCSDVLELDGAGGAFRHSGGYERFLLGREERMNAVQAAADNAATILRREEVWMAKQPKARQAKSQARQGAFYKLQEASSAVPQRMGTLDMEEGVVASRLGDIAVELKDASLSLGAVPILRNFSYAFSKGERVGIVGARPGCHV